MPDRIGRRTVFAALAVPLIADPALARPPFRLRKTPQPLLSPPILDEDGTTRTLEDYAGRFLLLNIWATWCPPCRKEMPTLDQLEAQLGGPDFAVLPLCIDDDSVGRGRAFYDEIGVRSLPLLWAEPLRVQLALAFVGLPTTLLIDRQGREIGRLQGPFNWGGEDARSQFQSLF